MSRGPFGKISYLMIEANSSCNLACLSCNRSELAQEGWREPRVLELAKFEALLDQFRDCPIDTIKFEGLSEPMLHPRFDELSRSLRDRFPKAFVIIATNLNYAIERTPFFRTLPYVDQVYVSIDGIGATQEKLRRGSSFARVLESLAKIRELASLEARKKIHINFTAQEANYRELPEIYALAEKHGLGGVRINIIQDWVGSRAYPHLVTDQMLEFLGRYRADVKGVADWDFKDCFWPFNGMIVDVDGNVRQCIINTGMNPIGNVFERPAEEIFNEAAFFQETRACLDANRPGAECGNCSYKTLGPYLGKVFGPVAGNPARRKAT